MNGLIRSRRRRALVALTTVALAFAAGSLTAWAADTSTTVGSSSSNGITRTALGEASPTNAPGQELYLQRVTIAPGAKLVEHFHQGTQVARVLSGVLTYNIVSGIAALTHAKGGSEQVAGPKVIRLHPGDSLVETAGLVHFGANATKKPVVIELAALLAQGAPLATPVGSALTGTPLHLTTSLESQDRKLFTMGADGSVVFGWNHLTGTATLNGETVGVEMLGNVSYQKGSGPFFGFVTYTFADGSSLGVQMQGLAAAAADASSTTFAATLGVISGTGKYATMTGTGTFTGSRTAALGTTVSATFDLTLQTAK